MAPHHGEARQQGGRAAGGLELGPAEVEAAPAERPQRVLTGPHEVQVAAVHELPVRGRARGALDLRVQRGLFARVPLAAPHPGDGHGGAKVPRGPPEIRPRPGAGPIPWQGERGLQRQALGGRGPAEQSQRLWGAPLAGAGRPRSKQELGQRRSRATT